jgi:chromosomal replication initiator protein
VDGPVVVNGIFTIPLGGRIPGASSGSESARVPSSAFVAGPENRLTGTALRAYMEQPATRFSPLVLYGPHGAGKSHLVHGLVDWRTEHFPRDRTGCLPGREFAREHAAALAQHRLEEWRDELNRLSLFVLEDLGQLAGKHAAQHELARLLDELEDREAMVVVTALSLPTHATVFSPALRSRLSAGLAVPLSLPGPEARRAILHRLATARGLVLSKRTINGLAGSLAASVPTLVSTLLELDLHGQLEGQPIDLRRVRQIATERRTAQAPTLREIASLTAKYFGLKLADLKSPQRRQPLVAGRGVAMYLARLLTDKSLSEIGAYFSGRDHTTVLHGCRRTEGLIGHDRATRQAIAELKRLLNAS